MDWSADAALLEEDAQSLLADISTDAERYARLKISELVLARAIEQYRVKNQGPLLRRAGEIFSRLTLESFEGLMTDFGSKDEDILVGVRSDGKERVTVSGMSDGTADQLYLALRLASLERYFDNVCAEVRRKFEEMKWDKQVNRSHNIPFPSYRRKVER